MAVQQIDKDNWGAFFDAISLALEGKRAEIEVASIELGDQILAEWLPLIGISYDHKHDLITVALHGVDHMIRSPRELHVDFDVGGVISLEIVDGGDSHQIVKLKDPLALPAPAGSGQR